VAERPWGFNSLLPHHSFHFLCGGIFAVFEGRPNSALHLASRPPAKSNSAILSRLELSLSDDFFQQVVTSSEARIDDYFL
jgi:hypothetical protein